MYKQYLSCLLSINEVKYYGMNKKKILLTILIAGVLAFISAFIFLRTDKPVQREAIKQETAEPKIEQPQEEKAEEKAEEKIEKPSSQKISESKKITPQKQITKNKITDKKNQAAVTPIKTEPLPRLEVKIEENKPEEINPKDFVVPLKYTSKNTYKYIYTPAGYKNK